MGKEVKTKSGNAIRNLRLELGLKTKDFKCEGISNPSRLETGILEISPSTACILADHINKIIEERNIDTKIRATPDLIRGKTNLITSEVLRKISEGEGDTKELLDIIDDKLKEINNEESIKLLDDTIQSLKNRLYENALFIREYCEKLLSLNISKTKTILVYVELIRVYYILEQYNEMIALRRIIEKDIDLIEDLGVRNKFWGNVSKAYFSLNDLKEAERCTNRINLKDDVSNDDLKLFVPTLKAICRFQEENFVQAEKAFDIVIERAIKVRDVKYIINSYINKAQIYIKMGELDPINNENNLKIANEHIEKADEFKRGFNDKLVELNCNYINLDIKANLGDVKSVEKLFNSTMTLAIKLNNKNKQNGIINKIVDMYFKMGLNNKIYPLLLEIKSKFNIEPLPETLIKAAKKTKNDSDSIKIIELYKDR